MSTALASEIVPPPPPATGDEKLDGLLRALEGESPSVAVKRLARDVSTVPALLVRLDYLVADLGHSRPVELTTALAASMSEDELSEAHFRELALGVALSARFHVVRAMSRALLAHRASSPTIESVLVAHLETAPSISMRYAIGLELLAIVDDASPTTRAALARCVDAASGRYGSEVGLRKVGARAILARTKREAFEALAPRVDEDAGVVLDAVRQHPGAIDARWFVVAAEHLLHPDAAHRVDAEYIFKNHATDRQARRAMSAFLAFAAANDLELTSQAQAVVRALAAKRRAGEAPKKAATSRKRKPATAAKRKTARKKTETAGAKKKTAGAKRKKTRGAAKKA